MTYPGKRDPRESLRHCGASEEECAFLVTGRRNPRDEKRPEWYGQRVELNAMTSRQFLDWLEEKLQAVGVEKVVPDPDTLTRAYQHLTRVAALQDTIDAALADPAPPVEAPADLQEEIRARITATDMPWDDALWDVVIEHRTDPEDGTGETEC